MHLLQLGHISYLPPLPAISSYYEPIKGVIHGRTQSPHGPITSPLNSAPSWLPSLQHISLWGHLIAKPQHPPKLALQEHFFQSQSPDPSLPSQLLMCPQKLLQGSVEVCPFPEPPPSGATSTQCQTWAPCLSIDDPHCIRAKPGTAETS